VVGVTLGQGERRGAGRQVHHRHGLPDRLTELGRVVGDLLPRAVVDPQDVPGPDYAPPFGLGAGRRLSDREPASTTRRRFFRALEGRGAFRRFKDDELHDEDPHLLDAWYAFRDTRANRRAVEWLVDNELIDDNARYLADHPTPTCLDRDGEPRVA
jgi:hypothetical protein